jgi:hypothetical protein
MHSISGFADTVDSIPAVRVLAFDRRDGSVVRVCGKCHS